MKEEKVQNPIDEQEAQGQNNDEKAEKRKLANAEALKVMDEIRQSEDDISERVVDEVEQSEYIIVPGLVVSRECVVKSGKKYYNYFMKGKIRGRDMTMYFRPAVKDGRMDTRAFQLLDMVFGTSTRVPFAVKQYKRKDSETKRVINGLTFYAYVYDEEYGKEYTSQLRPDQTSDREILLRFIDEANRRENLGLIVEI